MSTLRTSAMLCFASALLVLAACSSAPTEQPAPDPMADVELIDRDVLFGNPTRFQGRLSPDGTMMSFRAPLDGVMNIWVAQAG